MKPKTKEILFGAFTVLVIPVGFAIHGWPSLGFLLVGSICASFALYFTLLNHRTLGVTTSQSRNWALLLFGMSMFGAVLYWTEYKQPEKFAESKLDLDIYRPLVPANDPFPPSPDGRQIAWVATNAALFFFGNCLLVNPVPDAQPRTIVFGRENVSGKFEFRPMIGVSVTSAGAEIFGRFFGKDGKIVAVFRDNRPIVNVNNAFDPQRPDASTLILHDQYDNEVLNLRYMRPRVFRLTGSLYAPDGGWANVTESNVVFSVDSGTAIVNKMTLQNGAFFIGLQHTSGFGGSGPYISN